MECRTTMNLLDIIKGRRSIRRYQSREVEQEKIDKILEAGQWAPSASNRQPWHFIVIRDPETRKRLGAIHSHGRFMKESPVVIAVLGDPEAHEKYYLCDPHQAIQNLMLMAHYLELGTCWMGVRGTSFEPKMKTLLDIPDSLHLICTVSLGYPNEERTKTRKALSEIVSWEGYGQGR
jgi:nitroreductase